MSKTMTDMTKDEKRMMLYDVQEHPDRYTDEQIERLLADDDIRSFFDTNVLARMAGTKAHRQHVDVEQAWHHFQTSHSSSPRSTHYWLKAAASVIGIIFISGMVYAAVTQGWFTARTDSTPTQVQTAQGVPPTTTTPQAKPRRYSPRRHAQARGVRQRTVIRHPYPDGRPLPGTCGVRTPRGPPHTPLLYLGQAEAPPAEHRHPQCL